MAHEKERSSTTETCVFFFFLVFRGWRVRSRCVRVSSTIRSGTARWCGREGTFNRAAQYSGDCTCKCCTGNVPAVRVVPQCPSGEHVLPSTSVYLRSDAKHTIFVLHCGVCPYTGPFLQPTHTQPSTSGVQRHTPGICIVAPLILIDASQLSSGSPHPPSIKIHLESSNSRWPTSRAASAPAPAPRRRLSVVPALLRSGGATRAAFRRPSEAGRRRTEGFA